MTVVIACPICQQKIRAPKAVIGRPIKCPQCKNGFRALDASAIPVPTAVPKAAPLREPTAIGVSEPFGFDAADDVAAEAFPEGADEPDLTQAPAGGGKFLDYLLFRRMVTPAIAIGLFYFGATVILIAGLVLLVAQIVALLTPSKNGGGFATYNILMLSVALIATPVCVILWRIFCEVLMTLFRILDNLREINEKMTRE